MRNYDKDNIYLCCIKNYSKYKNRKFNLKKGFVYNNNYFSTFLKINNNSFFDLFTGEYYIGSKKPEIKIILKLNIKSKDNDVSERKISKEVNKYYSMIPNSYFI